MEIALVKKKKKKGWLLYPMRPVTPSSSALFLIQLVLKNLLNADTVLGPGHITMNHEQERE